MTLTRPAEGVASQREGARHTVGCTMYTAQCQSAASCDTPSGLHSELLLQSEGCPPSALALGATLALTRTRRRRRPCARRRGRWAPARATTRPRRRSELGPRRRRGLRTCLNRRGTERTLHSTDRGRGRVERDGREVGMVLVKRTAVEVGFTTHVRFNMFIVVYISLS